MWYGRRSMNGRSPELTTSYGMPSDDRMSSFDVVPQGYESSTIRTPAPAVVVRAGAPVAFPRATSVDAAPSPAAAPGRAAAATPAADATADAARASRPAGACWMMEKARSLPPALRIVTVRDTDAPTGSDSFKDPGEIRITGGTTAWPCSATCVTGLSGSSLGSVRTPEGLPGPPARKVTVSSRSAPGSRSNAAVSAANSGSSIDSAPTCSGRTPTVRTLRVRLAARPANSAPKSGPPGDAEMSGAATTG